MKQIQKWDVFEAAVHGKSVGNPFRDYDIFIGTAIFQDRDTAVSVHFGLKLF